MSKNEDLEKIWENLSNIFTFKKEQKGSEVPNGFITQSLQIMANKIKKKNHTVQ